jgi:serine/threonine-protein kinase HipA
MTAGLAAAAAAEATRWAAAAAGAAADASFRVATAGVAEAAAGAASAGARARGLSSLAETTPILRLHQEDMCQALAVPPSRKYQAEGGPGPREIATLLRAHSGRPQDDVWTFVDALGFNWLIGGTDAHAKNYSVLHGGGGRVRLAPLYDLARILPYEGFKPESVKLSMKFGGTYRLREIDGRAWRKTARELALDPEAVVDRLLRMARDLPERLEAVASEARANRLAHPIIERLVAVLSRRAGEAARSLGRL